MLICICMNYLNYTGYHTSISILPYIKLQCTYGIQYEKSTSLNNFCAIYHITIEITFNCITLQYMDTSLRRSFPRRLKLNFWVTTDHRICGNVESWTPGILARLWRLFTESWWQIWISPFLTILEIESCLWFHRVQIWKREKNIFLAVAMGPVLFFWVLQHKKSLNWNNFVTGQNMVLLIR